MWVSDGYVERALLPQESEAFAVEIPEIPGREGPELSCRRQSIQPANVVAGERSWLALLLGAVCLVGTGAAQDADLRAPSAAIAGTAASIATTGSGTATFYLVGPSITLKRDVHLGEEISLSAKELQSAGKYVAIVCGSSCRSVGFFVAPAKPVSLTFLVHPSRAPVGQNDVVSGVALPFDEFHNLGPYPGHRGLSVDRQGRRLRSRIKSRRRMASPGFTPIQGEPRARCR